ncbi:hypothetical protein Poly21_32520 [Allorhodopirellula heiligendammensis]|uniref:Uncharacterized protein n=1 Tax=Allorhodopirellula heiligendammensis TaxID=2714739 RepID=A0A5C6BWP1_9BACT|nr:hypothetical protein Poly21_32520 [Allorhodopirellula heiligendammensis]
MWATKHGPTGTVQVRHHLGRILPCEARDMPSDRFQRERLGGILRGVGQAFEQSHVKPWPTE